MLLPPFDFAWRNITLIIVFGFNGLNIFGAPTFSQYLFQGAILIIAVGLSSLGRMLAES